MKKIFAFTIIAFSAINSAQACKMSAMGASALEFSASLEKVMSTTSMKLQSISSIGKIYNAYGGVAVEVNVHHETPTCYARVFNVAVDSSCKVQVTERRAHYECL